MPVNYLRKYWVTFPLDYILVLAPSLCSHKWYQSPVKSEEHYCIVQLAEALDSLPKAMQGESLARAS